MEDYKKITLNSYDKNAKEFAERFKGLFDLRKRPDFNEFISLLNGRKKILDLGCGGGDHSLWFKDKGLDVYAIDLSEQMVTLAKEKGINAEVMDIENLKFEDNEFDGIWAVTSLLHVPKSKIAVIAEGLSNILKPEGILFICIKEGEGEQIIPDKQNNLTKRFFAYWKKDELIRILNIYFELIDFHKQKSGNTTYLNFFFRNRKLSEIS